MFFEPGEAAPTSIAAIEDYPSIRIVRLRGPIDRTTVSELSRFRKWLANRKNFKHKHILLDFKHVTRMDTSAVAEIVQAMSEMKSGNFRIGAIHVNEEFESLFQVLKVEKWVVLYGNESEALQEMVGKAK